VNAKELNRVACKLIEYCGPDREAMALANRIRDMMRDEDDLIDADWLMSLTGGKCEICGTLALVNVTEELSLVGDIDYPQRWQVWFNEYEIGECCNRAGFRSLCRGLGIALEEHQ
jgi:hypothetical protein